MVFSTLLVTLLTVSGVLGQDGWRVTYTQDRICALKGSSVDMPCTYSYPEYYLEDSKQYNYTVQKALWFIHWKPAQEPEDLSQDREYSGRVEYRGNLKSNCTFRIKQLREIDSQTYRFRFLTNNTVGKYTGQPGVILTVTALQVRVNPGSVTEGQHVTLTCSTTCTLAGSPAFTWYRDGSPLPSTTQIHQLTASSEDGGRYSCAIKGYRNLRSPAVALTVLYPPKRVSVSVNPSGEIEEGSSVTLTCSSDANPPVQIYTWFKDNRAVPSETGGAEASYKIKNFTQQDAGKYYCEAKNAQGAQSSTAVTLKVQGGWSWTAVAAAGAVGVAAIVALVFLGVLCMRRRKRSTNEEGNNSPVYDNTAGLPVSHTEAQGTDKGNGVQPANTRTQQDLLHSTVQKPLPKCEDDVQYASIRFLPSRAAPRSPAVKEDCALYSTVRKHQT